MNFSKLLYGNNCLRQCFNVNCDLSTVDFLFSNIRRSLFVSRVLTTPYYVVINGRKPGIYLSWPECRLQITKFPHATFKKFESVEPVRQYLKKAIALLKNETHESEERKQTYESMLEHCSTDVFGSISFVPADLETVPVCGAEDSVSEETKEMLEKETRIALHNEMREEEFSKDLQENYRTLCSIGEFYEHDDSSSKETLNFTVDEDGRVMVYSDGSCRNNGQTGASAGVGVYFGENNPFNVEQPLEGGASNNRAEVYAAIMGIRNAIAAGFTKVGLHTDSTYVIQGATVWSKKWVENGFRDVKGKKLANAAEWKLLLSLCKNVDVRWVHVQGHSDSDGNKMADELAKKGAAKYCNR